MLSGVQKPTSGMSGLMGKVGKQKGPKDHIIWEGAGEPVRGGERGREP